MGCKEKGACYSTILVLIILILAVSVSAAEADVCGNANRIIHYDVAAIDTAIPVNGWGDINPQGMMYALNNSEAIPNVNQIKDKNFKLYNTTDESLPKKTQPLVLRANVGDCIEINFANELNVTFLAVDPSTNEPKEAHNNRRNTGMEIMGLPYDPKTSAGSFVGANPDTTAAPGQSRIYRWYANRTGGFMFRDSSNTQWPQDTITKGLFGMVIVEPEGSTWRDSVTGRNFLKANPQNSYNYTDLISIGKNQQGKDIFLGVGASIFADVHQKQGAPLPKGTLLWENVSGNDYRDYAIMMHDEFEGLIGPVAWNEDGTIAAFGSPFYPSTGIEDGTFLINYRSEPLRNRHSAWERHRGLMPMPQLIDDATKIKKAGGLVNGSANTPFTNPLLGPPFVDITLPNGSVLTVNSSNMTIILPSGRKFGPNDLFCDEGNLSPDNARPGDINYTFYRCEGEEAHLQSWIFGDHATAPPRAYWGDAVVFYVGNVDAHDTHTFHQHTHRWFHDPDKTDNNNLPLPENAIQPSNRLDVQGVGAGEVFKIVIEQGAGSQIGTAGDSIFHCHLYPHFAGGLWSTFRIFDKLRINFNDSESILSTLNDGMPIYYPDGTEIAVLQPLPARAALYNTAEPNATDNRAPAPPGMPSRVPEIPDIDHPGYPGFVAGKFGLKALQPPKFIIDPVTAQPAKDRATPTQLEELASYDGLSPGVTLVDPCAGPNHEFGLPASGKFGPGRKPDRIYEPVAIQVPFIQNKKGGFFNPEQRLYAEKEFVNEIISDPDKVQPYSWRANVGDCVEYYATNNLQPDDKTPTLGVNDGIFRTATNTPEVSNHIHIIRFDQLGSDGTSVGWNYDISARSGETVAYRIFADINGRTVFNHDHQFPTSHQQGGMEAAFIIEPMNSTYRNPVNGALLGPTASISTYELTSKRYPIEEMKGVGVTADVIVNPTTSDTRGGISGGGISAFREFVVHYSDFTPSFVAEPIRLMEAFAAFKDGTNKESIFSNDFRRGPLFPPDEPDDFLKDQGTTTLNYRVEPFQARVNASSSNLLKREPAYVYSSAVHGDPETEVFRAYPGDPVVVRLMDGAHEEHHIFAVHGHRWLHQPSDPDSFVTDNQASNIGEWFNYEFIGTLNNTDTGNLLGAGLPGDYLFGSTSMVELWNGMWGIFRVENGLKQDLQMLPGRPLPQENPGLGLLAQTINETKEIPRVNETFTRENSPCPPNSPVKKFDIVAIQKSAVYSNFYNESDPFALMYVLAEDEQAVTSGEKATEPLVIRVNKGDCIEINLTNHLPNLTEASSQMQVSFPNGSLSNTSLDEETLQHLGDAPMTSVVEGLPIGGTPIGGIVPNANFTFVKWPMSNRVSLHPHLLKEVASVGDGATVGFMRDQTIGVNESITYLWYADESFSGSVLLDDYGDQRSHRHHGLFAALIVEPKNSIYLDSTNLSKLIRSGTITVIENTITGERFREFVPFFMDGINLRKNDSIIPDSDEPAIGELGACSPRGAKCEDLEQSGDAGINYRTERLSNRVPLNKSSGEINEIDFNNEAYSVFGTKDPETPVFEAFVGDPVVFRVIRPADLHVVNSIGISGHSWPHEPNNPDSSIVNVEGSFGVGKSFDFYIIGGAGGIQKAPGDYMYNSRNHVEGNVNLQGGQWGILRVHEEGAVTNIQPLKVQTNTQTIISTNDGGGGGGGGITASAAPSEIKEGAETGLTETFMFDLGEESSKTLILSTLSIEFVRLEISVKNKVKDAEIRIEALSDRPAETPLIEKPYQFTKVDTANIYDSDIKEVIVKFKVRKSWLTSNNVKASDIVLMRMANEWRELPTIQTSENDETYVYYVSSTPGFSYFAIAQKASANIKPQNLNITNAGIEIKKEEPKQDIEKITAQTIETSNEQKGLLAITGGIIGGILPNNKIMASLMVFLFVLIVALSALIIYLNRG